MSGGGTVGLTDLPRTGANGRVLTHETEVSTSIIGRPVLRPIGRVDPGAAPPVQMAAPHPQTAVQEASTSPSVRRSPVARQQESGSWLVSAGRFPRRPGHRLSPERFARCGQKNILVQTVVEFLDSDRSHAEQSSNGWPATQTLPRCIYLPTRFKQNSSPSSGFCRLYPRSVTERCRPPGIPNSPLRSPWRPSGPTRMSTAPVPQEKSQGHQGPDPSRKVSPPSL